MVMRDNIVYISGAVIFRDYRGKRSFLIVNQVDDRWEIPKVNVRRGESSVRAALRMTGEMAGINAKVLEEVGRASGTAIINGKAVLQRYYYYLMMQKSASEVMGFKEFLWLEYGKSIRKISLKREKEMLRLAKETLKEWEKARLQKKSS
jgi:hypothetical protein